MTRINALLIATFTFAAAITMSRYLQYSVVVAVSYLVFGITWVLWSDHLLAGFTRNQEQLIELGSFKGVIFVILSGLLIFGLSLYFNLRHLKYEKKLRELYQNDETMFSSFPLGFALVDLKGRFTKVNRNLCEILGYTEDELLRKNRTDISYSPDHEGDQDLQTMALLEGQKVYNANRRLVTKAGSLVWCSISFVLLRDEDNNPRHFVFGVQDVDGEMKMNEQVRNLNHELLEAQRTGSFGHWDYNIATKQIRISNQVYDILQLDEQEDAATQVLSLMNEDVRKQFRTMMSEIHADGHKLNTLVTLNLESGQIRHLNVEAHIVKDAHSQEFHLRGTVKDVTKVIRLQHEKDEFNNNLRNLAFSLSHELRRPLGSILGLTQLINQTIMQSQEQQQLMDYLQKSASDLDEQTRILSNKMLQMQKLLSDNSFRPELEEYVRPVFGQEQEKY